MKEGYKKTEIGVIPEDWEVVKTEEILIGDKSAIKIGPFGSQLKKEYLIEEGYKVYGQENIYRNDFSLGDRYINEDRFNQLKSSALESGDLVISMMGTVGKTAIIPTDIEKGIMDSHLIRLRVDEDIYNKELLRQMIQNSEIIKKQIKKLSVGGIMEGLSSTIIKQLKFPLISLEEQEKIAEILSTVDCKIDDTEMLIEKCRVLKKGLMQRLLSKGIGNSEFKMSEVGEIPVGWEVKKLGEYAEVTKLAGFEFTEYIEYIEDGEIIALRALNLKNGKLNLKDIKKIDKNVSENLTRSKLYKGNMLFSYVGTVGEVALIEEDDKYHLAPNVAKITLNENLIPIFALQYFRGNSITNEINKYITTTSQPALSMENIRKLKIIVPPLKEQEKIARVLSSVDNEIEEYENKKQKLEELKKGLMQQLLTGKIRTV